MWVCCSSSVFSCLFCHGAVFVVKFEGPWFTTQALISSSIGCTSFLVFCYCRMRWPLFFAPRTKLKGEVNDFRSVSSGLRQLTCTTGFSPHEAHAHSAFFGWIIPTLKISEYTVLQIVGLDAAVVSQLEHTLHSIVLLSMSASQLL
jgi:calcium permeable stress-gated cation channel